MQVIDHKCSLVGQLLFFKIQKNFGTYKEIIISYIYCQVNYFNNNIVLLNSVSFLILPSLTQCVAQIHLVITTVKRR